MLLLLEPEEKISHLGADFLGLNNPLSIFFVEQSSDGLIWVLKEVFHVTQYIHTTVTIVVLLWDASSSHTSWGVDDFEPFFVFRLLD
jgi:hypothetical protein